MWTTYASLRIFVSDRLAFTTFLIKELESQTKASSVAVLKPTTDLDGQDQKAFELIQQLSTMVTANGA